MPGRRQPHDGESMGELLVRGPWIVSGYFEDAEASAAAVDEDGWFHTGDVATIDPDGYMQIMDRRKDVIKSGGEWISSIDLENAADRASRCRRSCGRRRPAPALGRAAVADRDAAAGLPAAARRPARISRRALSALDAARRRRGARRAAAYRDRQGHEDPAARDVPRPPLARALICPGPVPILGDEDCGPECVLETLLRSFLRMRNFFMPSNIPHAEERPWAVSKPHAAMSRQ